MQDEPDSLGEIAAPDEADQERPIEDHGGFFLANVPEGGQIKPWHGVWRVQLDDDSVDTAVLGLHWLMRAGWWLIVTAKMGPRCVPVDPREAFFQGQKVGMAEAIQTLPEDVQHQLKVADSRRAAATLVLRHYGAWQAVDAIFQDVERAYAAQDAGKLRAALDALIQQRKLAIAAQAGAPYAEPGPTEPY